MRISVDEKDSSYKPDLKMSNIKIFLNSKEVKDCITADEELGYVRKYKRSSDGGLLLDEAKENILQEYLFGKVQIVIPEVYPEIKACPFCGGSAVVSGDPDDFKDDSRYVEMQISCCAVMSETIGWRRARDMTVEERRKELTTKLIRGWNTRNAN